jgi:hypothetical protein
VAQSSHAEMPCENEQDRRGKKESCGGFRRKVPALTKFIRRLTNAANLRAFRSKIKTVVT